MRYGYETKLTPKDKTATVSATLLNGTVVNYANDATKDEIGKI